MLRNALIQLRTTPEEKAQWTGTAASYGLDLSTWIRQSLNAAVNQKNTRQQEPAITSPQQEQNKGVIPKNRVW